MRGEKKYSILADHLGTPIEMYQDDGSLFWSREINANGKLIKGDNNSCPFLFQGQYYDAEIELAYNRFRYYDVEDGRYISQDPIGLLGGMIFYGYVHDTNNWFDIFGLSSYIKFKRWKRGDAINKPLPDGSNPSWDTVRSRYWKNRHHEAMKNGNKEGFSADQLEAMKKGNAAQDYNPNTGNMESRELHHVDPQRNDGSNSPINLREVTPEQHAAMDPYRHLGY
ncbi:RHS repeat-associated core domain-containing protein [Flavobacterium branchiophilum]|uniref:RHS repeat domain-containing protein n=1 Tax=Flavobacterium branchiophilum TaxID=55197 RepID=UPI000303C546|nr:RHS repeat-associated core domain-containing protein [Flavobacterium branchiophilum]